MSKTLDKLSQRVDYIDVAKGFGMLTIIWGHVFLDGLSNAIVFSFHIPLFFFLSGLVFVRKRYDSFYSFLKKRVKSLLVPYAIFSVLTWLVWAIFSYTTNTTVESYWMPLLQTLIAQGSDGYMVHNVPLWFVLCLFFVELIYYFLSQMKNWLVILCCTALCIIGVLSTKVTFFDFSTLPWSIDVAMMALPFYATGSILTKYIPHVKQVEVVINNKLLGFLLFIISIVIVYHGAKYNGYVSMARADLGNSPWVFYFVAFSGITVVLLFSILMSQLTSRIVSWLKWIGRNSFRMMAVHNPVKGVVIVILAKILHTSKLYMNSNNLDCMIIFIVTLLITIVVVSLIEWGLKKSLGRNSLFKK